MKLRTHEDYISRIHQDLVWRKKEINFSYLQAKSSGAINRKFYIRAGIALTYAHWEGYIKNCSELYLVHVKSQKKKYSDLKTNFLTIKFMNDLKNCQSSDSQKFFNSVLTDVLNCSGERANFSEKNVIKTNSNLTSTILVSILTIIGLDPSIFELKHNFIDEILVKSRNEIVHGEDIYYDIETLTDIKSNVIQMLDEFKQRLENAASLEQYKI